MNIRIPMHAYVHAHPAWRNVQVLINKYNKHLRPCNKKALDYPLEVDLVSVFA